MKIITGVLNYCNQLIKMIKKNTGCLEKCIVSFTCTLSSGHCDITEVPCGDVYAVVLSPVTNKGSKLMFCPKKICSGKI